MASSTTIDGNKGPEILAVLWACTTFATLLVITRLWIRQKVLRKLGVDDWLIAASMVGPSVNLSRCFLRID